MSGSAFAVTHHAFSSGAGRTSDGNGSYASTLKSPSYTKSVSWQHYQKTLSIEMNKLKQARYSIGIAMSEEKYSGIIGALRGKYINCLVTNSSTAELLLK